MKYIITENRFDKIADMFITDTFSNLTHERKEQKSLRRIIDIWRDNDDIPVIEIVNKESYPKVFVEGIPYDRIFYTLGLETNGNIQKHLINWFKKHMGVDVNVVYVFDHESDEP